jgi:hypothetical protein
MCQMHDPSQKPNESNHVHKCMIPWSTLGSPSCQYAYTGVIFYLSLCMVYMFPTSRSIVGQVNFLTHIKSVVWIIVSHNICFSRIVAPCNCFLLCYFCPWICTQGVGRKSRGEGIIAYECGLSSIQHENFISSLICGCFISNDLH